MSADRKTVIEKLDLEKLSNNELANLYQRFVRIYLDVWIWAIPTEFFSFYGEGVILPYCQKKIGDGGNKVFQVLSLPEGKSFSFNEEEDLFKIGLLIKD